MRPRVHTPVHLAVELAIMAAAVLLVAALSWGDDRALLAAMGKVESGNNDRAVGDHGRSRGRYQIQAAYWREACRFGKVRWDYKTNVANPARCRQVIRWTWVKYRARTNEQKARVHNGGPGGCRKAATLAYWRKIQRI